MASTAAVLAMDRTTLTAALKPLQRTGLVAVRVDPKDRQSRLLLLDARRQIVAGLSGPDLETHPRRGRAPARRRQPGCATA
ncbi:MAG: hypothetical protein ACJ8EE_01040 [Bradyrhizobium sp.]